MGSTTAFSRRQFLLQPLLFARSLESDAKYDQTGLQYHPKGFFVNFHKKIDSQTKDIPGLGPKDTVSV